MTTRLAEWEADCSARLEQIHTLTGLLKQSEDDRAARLEQIVTLTDMVHRAEANRAPAQNWMGALMGWLKRRRLGERSGTS